MLSKPLKAAPSSGADGDRASWDEVTSLACRRRTLLRQLSVPRRRPRLSKAGGQKQWQDRVSNRDPAFARSINIVATSHSANFVSNLFEQAGVGLVHDSHQKNRLAVTLFFPQLTD